MRNNIYMIVDIGGTKIATSLFSSKGKFLGRKTIPTDEHKGPIEAIERIYRTTESFLKKKKLTPGNIRKIAVGCPGPFDYKLGKIMNLPNLHSWKDFSLRERLKRKFQCPVIIENDANLAALGEATFGAGKNYENVLYITFSTGIGGGFIENGKIYRGASGDAFEIGHMILKKNGKKCGCGKQGCLEAMASGSAIEREAKAYALKNKKSKLYKIYKKQGFIDVEAVLKCVKAKDKPSTRIWNEAIDYLGMGISNLIQIVNPNIIVIGGGIAKSWNLIIKPLQKNLKRYTWRRPLASSKVVRAILGDRAADLGGFYLLKD